MESLLTKVFMPSLSAFLNDRCFLNMSLAMYETCSYSNREFSTNSVSTSAVQEWHIGLLFAVSLGECFDELEGAVTAFKEEQNNSFLSSVDSDTHSVIVTTSAFAFTAKLIMSWVEDVSPKEFEDELEAEDDDEDEDDGENSDESDSTASDCVD